MTVSPLFKTAALLVVVAFLVAATAIVIQGEPRLIMNDRGYEPVQPIAFSHQLHAGELAIGCLHCHAGADKSRHAGVPSVSVCMNCHRFVQATQNDRRIEEAAARTEGRAERPVVSPEIAKLLAAAGWTESSKPDSWIATGTVPWIRVHNLPDFVHFNHSRHVNGGVECAVCHGPVESMERVRQIENFSMGYCVNCHRAENEKRHGVSSGGGVRASIDCAACHF